MSYRVGISTGCSDGTTIRNCAPKPTKYRRSARCWRRLAPFTFLRQKPKMHLLVGCLSQCDQVRPHKGQGCEQREGAHPYQMCIPLAEIVAVGEREIREQRLVVHTAESRELRKSVQR
jgi:hypothetical protein